MSLEEIIPLLGKANTVSQSESIECFIKGPGFLAFVWFSSSAPPPFPSVSLIGDTQETTYWQERGEGAKSYDDEKAWFSVNTLWLLCSAI